VTRDWRLCLSGLEDLTPLFTQRIGLIGVTHAKKFHFLKVKEIFSSNQIWWLPLAILRQSDFGVSAT